MKLLGDRRTADDRTPLEHDYLEPGGSEVRRAHEPVVTSADDQRIVARAIVRPFSHDSGPAVQ